MNKRMHVDIAVLANLCTYYTYNRTYIRHKHITEYMHRCKLTLRHIRNLVEFT
jgi:hypothetical protein